MSHDRVKDTCNKQALESSAGEGPSEEDKTLMQAVQSVDV